MACCFPMGHEGGGVKASGAGCLAAARAALPLLHSRCRPRDLSGNGTKHVQQIARCVLIVIAVCTSKELAAVMPSTSTSK